jgi:hypothetical protein
MFPRIKISSSSLWITWRRIKSRNILLSLRLIILGGEMDLREEGIRAKEDLRGKNLAEIKESDSLMSAGQSVAQKLTSKRLITTICSSSMARGKQSSTYQSLSKPCRRSLSPSRPQT